jgi:hypothetical protein
MTLSRSLAFVIIAGTGIVGGFIGRAARSDAPPVQANASVSPAPSVTTPADEECELERAALASIKAQLATCMTIDTAAPETEPSSVPELPEPEPAPVLRAVIAEEIKNYHERLESLSEAVIVRHADGTIGIYKPDEWPIDGDGLIVGRKFKDGQIGRYAGPDAGPRSDPAAFRVRRKKADE